MSDSNLPPYVHDLSCLKRSSPSSSPSLSNEEIATHNLQILTNLKANDSHVKLGHYVVEGLENCKVCLESCLKSLSTNCLRLCLKLSAYETLKTQIEDYIKLYPEFRVILLSSSQLESLTGFPIRRGAIGYGKIPEMRKATSRGIICLDKINDTSNLGGIIRTASNLGYDLALSEDCCSEWYRRSIRTSMGEVFRVNVERVDLKIFLEEKMRGGWKVLVTSLSEGCVPLTKVDVGDVKFCVVFGNEGEGVRKEVEDLSDVKVRIESIGEVDSFNVGVSVGIVGYWLGRSGRDGSGGAGGDEVKR